MTGSLAANRQLVRALTLVPAAAVILASIIGTGVFVFAVSAYFVLNDLGIWAAG